MLRQRQKNGPLALVALAGVLILTACGSSSGSSSSGSLYDMGTLAAQVKREYNQNGTEFGESVREVTCSTNPGSKTHATCMLNMATAFLAKHPSAKASIPDEITITQNGKASEGFCKVCGEALGLLK